MADERGQAMVEWVALVLMVALALGALVAFGPHVDGRSYGGFLAREIVCAVRGGCDDGRDQLIWAYGQRDAALVREYSPNIVYEPGEKEIPVDFRRCRSTRCGNAPADRSLDVSRTNAGLPATAFTHVLHEGGSTYLQYWFYYPDSNTTWARSDKLFKFSPPGVRLVSRFVTGKWRYPGFHNDDWGGTSSTLAQPNFGQAVATRSVRRLFDHRFQECRIHAEALAKPQSPISRKRLPSAQTRALEARTRMRDFDSTTRRWPNGGPGAGSGCPGESDRWALRTH
jgi:hypothetical protein